MDSMPSYPPIFKKFIIWFKIFWSAHVNYGLLFQYKLHGTNKDKFVATIVCLYLEHYYIYTHWNM
jgi:hypothetical protein